MKKLVNRREFLKLSALTAVGATAAACGAWKPRQPRRLRRWRPRLLLPQRLHPPRPQGP